MSDTDMSGSERKHTWLQLCEFRNAGKNNCYLIYTIHCILCLNQYLNMEAWQATTLDRFKDEALCFKEIYIYIF